MSAVRSLKGGKRTWSERLNSVARTQSGPRICDEVHYFIADAPRLFACIGRVNSRTRSMKRSTTGLTVRFLSVNIANCHGRTDNSTGNIFTGDWDASDRGIAAMN